jgi:hypothetical protein
MKVEIFTLCDAATDQRGKLNILGTFDLICATQTPVAHPICAIALRNRFSKLEEGEHVIKLTITDADGKAIVPPIGGKLDVRMAPETISYAQNMVFNLHSLRFSDFGDYSINLFVDTKLIDSLPIYVRQASTPEVKSQV